MSYIMRKVEFDGQKQDQTEAHSVNLCRMVLICKGENRTRGSQYFGTHKSLIASCPVVFFCKITK